jgi:hypothetical protein
MTVSCRKVCVSALDTREVTNFKLCAWALLCCCYINTSAREMGAAALAEKLKDIGMGKGEHARYTKVC